MPSVCCETRGGLITTTTMKYLILLSVLLLESLSVAAQLHDRYWITGYSNSGFPPYQANIFDFATSPPAIYSDVIPIETVSISGAISDAEGNLLFYTNGGQVRNRFHELIENGDSLNFSPYGFYPSPIYGTAGGYGFSGTLFILPGTHNKNWYHIIHQAHEWCYPALPGLCFQPLLHTLVDISANNGAGKVIFKNRPLVNAWALEYPAATRHANGRDWWIVVPDYLSASYHTLLFNDAGIVDSFTQVVGYKPAPNVSLDKGGANLFSPDGRIYVDADARNGHRIFDFDRCTGQLSGFRWISLIQEQLYAGAAISPNNRFLYISARAWLMQYDLWAGDTVSLSVDTVAVWDGFYSPIPPFATTFGPCQLALDGKIYIAPTHGVYHLHYIQYPDKKGKACEVVQHGLELPNIFAFATPVHPNYRLGPLRGSPCDTLTTRTGTALQEQVRLRFYPNPAQQETILEVGDASAVLAEGLLEYRLLNGLGVVVLQDRLPSGATVASVPVGQLPEGVYVCQMLHNGQVLGTARLSVIRP